MNNSEFTDFCCLINACDENTKGKERSKAGLSLMFKMLQEYSFKQVEKAVFNHMKTSNFTITVADINNYYGSSVNTDIKAGEIFKKVIRAIGAYGYDDINFGCKKVHYAIMQVGGLKRICNSEEKELIWIEKEFKEAYKNSDKINLESIQGFVTSPYINDNKQIVNVNLNKPKVERKALPGPVEEERINFTDSPEFIKFQEQLRRMF